MTSILTGWPRSPACGPWNAAPTGVRIDQSWIQLSAIRRLLADALPAPTAAFAVREHDDLTLVAYLAASGGIATPEQAHEACMKVLRAPDSAGRPATRPSRPAGT